MSVGMGRVLGLLAIGVGLFSALPGTAQAIQAGCARTGQTVTCTYNNSENGLFTVPPGIGQISVDLVGGTGGGASSSACAPVCGGAGAHVTGPVAVTPGQQLDVFAAGNAPDGSGYAIHNVGVPASGAIGCYTGGGASAVWVDGNSTPAAVAAGGGGDGCQTAGGDPETQGGNAGAAGGTGANPQDGRGGNPGNGTVAGLGGAGGAPTGTDGFGGTGDAGEFGRGGEGGGSSSGFNGPVGGGGGGGLGGGGGGGGGVSPSESAAGGGGGGGSSLVPAGGSLTLDSTRTPLVTLAFTSILAFTSPAPPPAIQNTEYAYSYTAVGDTDMTYAVTGGQLPSGLSLRSDGSLSGSPDRPGTFSYTIAASDGSTSVARQDTITVSAPVNPEPSRLALTCLPGTVFAGETATCVATVANGGGSGQPAPTGTIGFSSEDGGTFTPQGTCTLTGAICHVGFAPPTQGSGSYFIVATYSGDPSHEQASADTFVASAPVAGKTANISVVRGKVAVRLANGQPVPLGQGTRAVPLGATVDVSKGVIRLTTRLNYGAHASKEQTTATGTFSAGLFTARQKLARARRTHKATTELLLQAGKNATARAGCHQSGPPGKGVVRSLHGVAKGLYQTLGAASVTTVTNGSWTVQDRCDGTVTRVTSGHATVLVTRGRRRTVHLHAGQSLLVRARFLQAKQHAHQG
jgi:hypothetical protein